MYGNTYHVTSNVITINEASVFDCNLICSIILRPANRTNVTIRLKFNYKIKRPCQTYGDTCKCIKSKCKHQFLETNVYNTIANTTNSYFHMATTTKVKHETLTKLEMISLSD